MMPIIDIDGFSFGFGGAPVLRSVSLHVHAGEYISIIGPNGAGKSTLLKCLMRIHRGGRGRIAIDGLELGSYSQRRLARIVSYIPQEDTPGIPYTVADYVMLSRYPYLSPFSTVRQEDRRAVRDALDITGANELANRQVDTLSGGERRTVAVAAALAQGGRIMLLDEPTTFLDPKHEADVIALIRQVNRDHGITIVSVTHNINHAALSSNRVAILRGGRCVFTGEPRDMMTNEVLAPVYDREFTFIPHPETGFPVIIPEGSTR